VQTEVVLIKDPFERLRLRSLPDHGDRYELSWARAHEARKVGRKLSADRVQNVDAC